MPTFTCPSCGYSKELSSNLVGKRVACPRCKSESRIAASHLAVAQKPAHEVAPSKRKQELPVLPLLLCAGVSALVTSLAWGIVVITLWPAANARQIVSTPADQVTPAGSAKPIALVEDSERKTKRQIVAVLKKMESYTEVGINLRNFSAKLLDVNAELSRELSTLPDSEFTKRAKNVMLVYKDCSSFWSSSIEYDGQSCWATDYDGDYFGSEFADLLPEKYSTYSVSRFFTMASERLKKLEGMIE